MEQNDKVIDLATVKQNPTSLNRQQRRAQQRINQGPGKKNRQLEKEMNSTVPKREILGWVNAVSAMIKGLESRLSRTELMVAATFKVLTDKNLINDSEIDEAINFERQRSVIYKEIQETPGNYEDKLEKVKKWDIGIGATSLVSQITADKKLTDEQRKALLERCEKLQPKKPPKETDEKK